MNCRLSDICKYVKSNVDVEKEICSGTDMKILPSKILSEISWGAL